jgi:hypothetical protein
MRNQHLRYTSLFGSQSSESISVNSEYRFIRPWMAVDPNHVEGMCNELKKELIPGHILYGLRCIPIGNRCDCDDTVWKVFNAEFTIATVHLTFQKETNPRWPDTQTFDSFETFHTCVMLPDNEEYEME